MIDLLKNLFHVKQTDFKALVQEGAVIVDVRTQGEFKSGHIRGSRNIPLDSIKNKLPELKKLGKPVITVCRSGSRSSMAKSILTTGGLIAYNGGAWDSLDRKL
jgi:phage shock protein E